MKVDGDGNLNDGNAACQFDWFCWIESLQTFSLFSSVLPGALCLDKGRDARLPVQDSDNLLARPL